MVKNNSVFLKGIAFGAMTCVVMSFVMLLIFAFLMSAASITVNSAPLFSSAAVLIGAFAGGIVTSFITKEKGLFSGAVSGAITAALLLLISFFTCAEWTLLSFLVPIGMIVLSAVGGIIGVNRDQRRIRYSPRS